MEEKKWFVIDMELLNQEKVYVIADNVVNSLGYSTVEVATAMKEFRSGCQQITGFIDATTPAMLGAICKLSFKEKFENIATSKEFTFFEQLLIFSIQAALSQTKIDTGSQEVLFLFSTTKGNIEWLEHPLFDNEKIHIWKSAALVTRYFNNKNKSLIISNACISGTQAIITAKYLLQTKQFKHIIVCGADVLSRFIVSGFHSFKALSPQICKPFDIHRDGLNIGEGAATMILSLNKENAEDIEVFSGASSNDANHISGPSRTGEGLYLAMEKALQKVDRKQLAFINAHGTATPFNDEMEAIAFSRAQLEQVPVNSYKAYFGHTLGAAGLMETALSAYALKHNFVFGSKGYEYHGVSVPININSTLSEAKGIYCLKTASGFGGCNAALVLKKGGCSGE